MQPSSPPVATPTIPRRKATRIFLGKTHQPRNRFLLAARIAARVGAWLVVAGSVVGLALLGLAGFIIWAVLLGAIVVSKRVGSRSGLGLALLTFVLMYSSQLAGFTALAQGMAVQLYSSLVFGGLLFARDARQASKFGFRKR